jgi:decaprenylphospho-beta-D-erythro-pentofuranosid-2-ulose 2-reductase
MKHHLKIVIVGATSAIAEQCARAWLSEAPAQLQLVGRRSERLELIAADLRIRSPASEIRCATLDFHDVTAIKALTDSIYTAGGIDIVLIAHGNLPNQHDCENDLQACRDALEINALSPVLFAEAFIAHMAQANHGTLAIIGSVAGDRGRKSNYVYGAAKGLIARYAQGLQHRLAASLVKVVLIKPGPTDTPMTAHLKAQGAAMADAGQVAALIVQGIKTGKRIVYAPGKWRLIMSVIRHLPWLVFRRMDI